MLGLFRITPAALWVAACASGGAVSPPAEAPGGLRISPNPAVFENTLVGCQRTLALELANASAENPLQVTEIAFPNGNLTLQATLPLLLEAGATAAALLRFAPITAGDWSGDISIDTSEEPAPTYHLAATAVGLERPLTAADLARAEPLDLVFVLDVSTTMDEMAQLRVAMGELFDFIEANDLDVRFGLTTFENDVVVHGSAEFLTREAFFRELDTQLVEGSWVPDPELPRQLINFDLPENILDALYRSATGFDFRPEARRAFLLMTDDTFLEAPASFSDGTPASVTYREVLIILAAHDVRLLSVHRSAKGRGLSSDYRGQPSLVAANDGTWFELADVASGALPLDALLADLVVGAACD